MCVTLTPAATKFMKMMSRLGQAGPVGGFRLTVKPGGCSGFDSSFTIEAAPHDGDAVIEEQGVRLFLESASCELLRGFTIDFKESRLEGGLAFSRPGVVQSCCGAGASGAMSTVSFMPKPRSTQASGLPGPDAAVGARARVAASGED